MKKIFITILACLAFTGTAYAAQSVFNSNQVGNSAVNGYVLQTTGPNNQSTWVATSTLGIGQTSGTSFSTTTTTIYIDSNRTDAYVADGSIFRPYKSIASAIKNYPASYWITPGTYIESGLGTAGLTFTATSTIEGNQATIIAFQGTAFASAAAPINFNTGFVGYDMVIALASHVNLLDPAVSDPGTFQNSFISASIQMNGLATIQGGQLQGGSLYTGIGSLTNIVGTNILDTIFPSGTINLNDVNLQPVAPLNAASGGYAVMATTTGSVVDISGMSLENYSSSGGAAAGGGIYCANGATSVPNNLTNIGMTLGTTTSAGTINCGTSVSSVGSYTAEGNVPSSPTRLYGTFLALFPYSFAGLNVEGNTLLNVNGGFTGIGTSSPWTALSVNGSSDLGINALAGTFTATSTTASSTFGNGINFTHGCITYNGGACVGGSGGSGTVNTGLAGQNAFYASNGTAVSPTSTPFLATNGFLGVGSTSPTAPFTVQSANNAMIVTSPVNYPNSIASIQGSAQDANLQLWNTASGGQNWLLLFTNALDTRNGGISFFNQTTGKDTLEIAANGNVGIGKVPAFALDVTGTINTATPSGGNPTFQFNDGNWKWFRDDTNSTGDQFSLVTQGIFGAGGTRQFIWQDTAGTRSFSSFISEVAASSGTQNFFSITPSIDQTGTASYNGLTVNVTEFTTGSGSKDITNFEMSGVSKEVLTDTGLLGIGTTTPWAQLSVEGTSTLGNLAYAGSFSATTTNATSTFSGSIQMTGYQDVVATDTAASTNFPNAKALFMHDDVGGTVISSQNIGGLGEASADATHNGRGLYGIAIAKGSLAGQGFFGIATVTASTDTGQAYGSFSEGIAVHSGALNIGGYGLAQNSSVGNYGLNGEGYTFGSAAGVGVLGTGFVGSSGNTATSYGVYGQSTSVHTGGPNIGIYGVGINSSVGNIGILAQTTTFFSNPTTAFEADVFTSNPLSDSATSYDVYATSSGSHIGNSEGIFSSATNGALNYSFYSPNGILYNAGNVGIGTTSPYQSLSIVTTEKSTGTNDLILDTSAQSFAAGGPIITFAHGGTVAAQIQGSLGASLTNPYLALTSPLSGFSVGIGTSTPAGTFAVQGPSGTSATKGTCYVSKDVGANTYTYWWTSAGTAHYQTTSCSGTGTTTIFED